MPRNKSRQRKKNSRNDLSQKPRKKARKKSRKKQEEARRIMVNEERKQHRQESLMKPTVNHEAVHVGERSLKINQTKPSAAAELAAKRIRQEADLNHCSPADKIRAAFIENEIPRPTDFSEYKPKPETPRFIY
jgi:hypothetical protein